MQLAEARRRHSIVRDTLAQWRGQKPQLDALEGAWAAATATPDNGCAMASSVRTSIPLNYIPLFRSWDAVPATYFLHCVSEAMAEMTPDPTDLADMLYCANLAQRAFALFEQRRQQADTIEEGFGCDRSAAWGTLRKCDDKSQYVTQKMVKIAKLAGRMFKALRYEGMPKPTNDPQMVTGVGTGDEVSRMLDEEVALLNVPGADAETLSRLEEQQVSQFDMSGETLHGRGPLVMTIDESGSMHENRQVWSKACAVALARVALAEGRRVRVVHFSTVTVVRDLDPSDADSMRELAWSHLSGGTDVDCAMEMSVQQCKELENEGIVGADIVFITDGQDSYTEDNFKEMKKRGILLWTIAIDIDISQGNRYGSNHLVTYAKKYLHIDDRALTRQEGADAVGELREAALDNEHRDLGAESDSIDWEN